MINLVGGQTVKLAKLGVLLVRKAILILALFIDELGEFIVAAVLVLTGVTSRHDRLFNLFRNCNITHDANSFHYGNGPSALASPASYHGCDAPSSPLYPLHFIALGTPRHHRLTAFIVVNLKVARTKLKPNIDWHADCLTELLGQLPKVPLESVLVALKAFKHAELVKLLE